MENLNEELEDFDETEEDFEEGETLEDEEEDLEEDSEETEEEEEVEEESNSKTDNVEKQSQEEKERLAKKEQNRINAERRKREKEEREQALRKQGYNDALKEEIGGINPYTNKKIEDEVDMEMYLKMRELSKQGKDPLYDYADYVANERRKAMQQEQAKKVEETKAQEDINTFSTKYPDVDVAKLLSDEHFSSFADGKLGNKPLAQVYEEFLKFETYYNNKSEAGADMKAIKKYARIQSSMGSQTSTEDGSKKKSYKDMSDAEFELELQRVKQGY